MPGYKRILIVDDDAKVLLIMKATLDSLEDGIEVITAGDGHDALKKIRDKPFDLIISDVRMYRINGIALVEAIRAQRINTTVIWITAYGCDKLEAERQRLNVYGCLEKPLRIENIRQAALSALKSTIPTDEVVGSK